MNSYKKSTKSSGLVFILLIHQEQYFNSSKLPASGSIPVSLVNICLMLVELKDMMTKSPVFVFEYHLIKPIMFSVAPVLVVFIPAYPVLPIVSSKKNNAASSSDPPGTPSTL